MEKTMSTRTTITLINKDDAIQLYTRWDGYLSYIADMVYENEKKMKNTIKQIRKYVKKKGILDRQTEFLQNWSQSIENLLKAPRTLENQAMIYSWNDLGHFYPCSEGYADPDTYIDEPDFAIIKKNGKYELLVDPRTEAILEEYAESNEDVVEKIRNAPRGNLPRFNTVLTDGLGSIPLSAEYSLIKVKSDRKDVLPSYIKMKNFSRQELLEIMAMFPFAWLSIMDLGYTGLKEMLLKSEDDDGDDLELIDRHVNDEFLESLFFKVRRFSIFEYCLDLNRAKEVDELFNDNDKVSFRIASHIPFDLFHQKFLLHLSFFYPDRFFPLTVKELNEVLENKTEHVATIKVKNWRIADIELFFPEDITEEEKNSVLQLQEENDNYWKNALGEKREVLEWRIKYEDEVNVFSSKYKVNKKKIMFCYELMLQAVVKQFDKNAWKTYVERKAKK